MSSARLPFRVGIRLAFEKSGAIRECAALAGECPAPTFSVDDDSDVLYTVYRSRSPDAREARMARLVASGLKGNPVRIRDCPAAVCRNDRRHLSTEPLGLGSDGQ